MNTTGKAKVGARFTTGSTMNHVVVMTFTSAIGLMAMFLVDLIDLWFITMLDIIEATAAIGFAGTIVFSNLSVGLGMSIAGGALVAQALGRDDEDEARQAASSTLVLSLATGVLVAIPLFILMAQLLDRSKVSDALFEALYVVMGGIKGGLALAAFRAFETFPKPTAAAVHGFHAHHMVGQGAEACATCHPGAHRQFAGYLTHATHHDPDKYPFLFYAFGRNGG